MQMIVRLFFSFVFLLCIFHATAGGIGRLSKRHRDACYQVSRVTVIFPPRPGASKQGRINVVSLLPETGEGASLRIWPPSFTRALQLRPRRSYQRFTGSVARKCSDRQHYQIMVPIASTQDFCCSSMKSKLARVAGSRKHEEKKKKHSQMSFISQRNRTVMKSVSL